MNMELITFALVCSLAISGVQAHPCDGCRYDNGVGYLADGSDCRNFLQCVNYGARYYTKTCATGTYWTQDSLTCTTSRDTCTAKIPHAKVEDAGSWVAVCDGSTRPKSGDQTKYEQKIPGGRWVERPCAPGTVYERANCTCVQGGAVTYQPCTPELYIPFTDGVTDKSGKNVHVDNQGVKVSSGFGVFADNTGLRLNRFSNTHFGSSVTFTFQMQPTGHVTARGRAVMSNSQCKDTGSIYVINKGSSLDFRVSNVKGVVHVLSVPYKAKRGKFNTVTLEIRNGNMKAIVNENTRRREFKGGIKSTHCALQVGQGTGYDNFIGLLDNFKVSFCKA